MIEGVEAMEAVGDYFDAFLSDLTPARRKMVARKLGQRMRRLNTARIAENVEPSGDPMAPRRPRRDRRGRLRKPRGKMFRKLRYARNWKIRATANSAEISLTRGDAVASIHHFGLFGFVGKTKAGETIRARYERRRLLGFGDDDLDQITEELLAWLDND